MGALVHHVGSKVTLQPSRDPQSKASLADIFFELVKLLVQSHNEALEFACWALGDMGVSTSILRP